MRRMALQVTARVCFVTLLLCGSPCSAVAQRDYTRLNAERGAEVSLFGGGVTRKSGVDPSFGWSVGWRPTRRVVIEGSGTWMWRPGVDGFAALVGPRVYLSSSRRTSAFLSAEGGLFHASVDGSDPSVPDFYRDRTFPGAPEKAFNDFVVSGGGGIDVHLGGRLWLRPAGRLLTVVDGWKAHSMFGFGVNISYDFITPSSP